jgi:hypothetical protein
MVSKKHVIRTSPIPPSNYYSTFESLPFLVHEWHHRSREMCCARETIHRLERTWGAAVTGAKYILFGHGKLYMQLGPREACCVHALFIVWRDCFCRGASRCDLSRAMWHALTVMKVRHESTLARLAGRQEWKQCSRLNEAQGFINSHRVMHHAFFTLETSFRRRCTTIQQHPGTHNDQTLSCC